jgi:hypothetical protein
MYTLAFALQLRKKHGKTSLRVAGECQLEPTNASLVIQLGAYLPAVQISFPLNLHYISLSFSRPPYL